MTTVWNERLRDAAVTDTLARLYGADRVPAACARVQALAADFAAAFGAPPEALFSAPGRTELGGNHTDHQRGHVLAAAVDLDMLAAVRPNGTALVRLRSQGYGAVEIDLRDLMPHSEETGTTAALLRGVAAGLAARGCELARAGFDGAIVSAVPGGSGLSSSAALEVLLGTVWNELFFHGRFSPVELARVGQYAENVYFGKPCGLMDQMACAVGGAVAMDFGDPVCPVVEQIPLDLTAGGYALCILESGADHTDLTADYAAITDEMGAVSRYFGQEVLRDVPEREFFAALPALRRAVGDRAVLRALHFYNEDGRAVAQAKALRAGEVEEFLSLVRASGRSSALYLQNTYPAGAAEKQALMVTMALCQQLLAGRGAVRVHGGGFGGTAQAFVPLDSLPRFCAGIEALLGVGSCRVVRLRPVGGLRIL